MLGGGDWAHCEHLRKCSECQVLLCNTGLVLEPDISACAYNKKAISQLLWAQQGDLVLCQEIGGGKTCEGEGLETKKCGTECSA